MPLSPPLPPFSTNAPSKSPNDFSLNYSTPPSAVSVSLPNFNMPQPQVVTTPISLPGMPPITVSASLPQNSSFYPSTTVQQQSQVINVPPPTQ